MTDSPDSLPGLTVRAAAQALDLHVQTMRGRLRDAEEAGEPIGVKLTGDFGPEWRLCPAVVEALRIEAHGAGAPDLRQADSPESETLREILTLIRGLREAQKALPDPTAREDRIARGLTSNAEIIRDLAAQVGRLQAERDRLQRELEEARADRDQLRDELDAEKQRTWWDKLTKN